MTSESMGKCPACRAENVPLKDVGGLFICEKCSSKKFSNKVRKSIQEAFEKQEEQQRRVSYKKRIDTAKKGVQLFEKGKTTEALKAFREYLSIVETHFGVEPGGLSVNLFDAKKEAGEILLITGIYWDMAKIYDRVKGKQNELRSCLNKYIEFSIDKPHMILSSEAIRKYLGSGQAINVQDFRSAHALLRSHLTRCFIATSVFGPTSTETKRLQRFRDEYLKQHNFGRTVTAFYYKISPSIASVLIQNPKLNLFVRFPLRCFSILIDRFFFK